MTDSGPSRRIDRRTVIIGGAVGLLGLTSCSSPGTMLGRAPDGSGPPAGGDASTTTSTAIPPSPTTTGTARTGVPTLRSGDIVARTGVGVRALVPPYRDIGHDRLIALLRSARIGLVRATWYANEKHASVGAVYRRYADAGIRLCLLADFQEADRGQRPEDVDYSHQGKIAGVPTDPPTVLPYSDRLDTGSPERAYGAARFRSSVLRGEWPVPTYLESLNEAAAFFASAAMYSSIPASGNVWRAGESYRPGETIYLPPNGTQFTCRQPHVANPSNRPDVSVPDKAPLFTSAYWWPTWVAASIEHDRRLRGLIDAYAPWRDVRLTTASLTAINQDGPFELGASVHADVIALHNYSTPLSPGYLVEGGVENGERFPGVVRPGNRIAPQTGGRSIVTEYGAGTAGSLTGAASAADLTRQATFHQQAVLEFGWWTWRGAPFEAWMLYELVDFWPEGSGSGEYGLLFRDGSPKPAFSELARLLDHLFDDGADAATFAPSPLGLTATSGPPGLRYLPLSRSNGAYQIAVWIQTGAVSESPIGFAFDRPFRTISVYRPRSGQSTQIAAGADRCEVTVHDDPQIIDLIP